MNNSDTVESKMEYMRGYDVSLIKRTLENAKYPLSKGGKVPLEDLMEITQLVNNISKLLTVKLNESLR